MIVTKKFLRTLLLILLTSLCSAQKPKTVIEERLKGVKRKI